MGQAMLVPENFKQRHSGCNTGGQYRLPWCREMGFNISRDSRPARGETCDLVRPHLRLEQAIRVQCNAYGLPCTDRSTQQVAIVLGEKYTRKIDRSVATHRHGQEHVFVVRDDRRRYRGERVLYFLYERGTGFRAISTTLPCTSAALVSVEHPSAGNAIAESAVMGPVSASGLVNDPSTVAWPQRRSPGC